MTGLSPGVTLPKDMDQRQFATWCRQQSIETVATTAAADAVAAHVALADPHTQYALDTDLTAAIAALSLASGTYTPTLFNTTNVAASTAYSCQYLRVGSVVTVSGKVDVDPTAAGFTVIGISLPIASNLANGNELGGTGAAPGIAGLSAGILADSANDRAVMEWTAVDITNQSWAFQFLYRIL